jgi:membrane fusion protein (multidrug efflux system)
MPPIADANSNDRQSNRIRNFKILGAVVTVIALIFVVDWLFGHNTETTDDAFIDGDVVQLAPQTGGRVLKVHFQDNDVVKEGDLLVEIDPRDAQVQVDSAQAAFDAAKARVSQAQANLDMVQVTAVAEHARAEQAFKGAKQQMEEARFTAEAAKAEAERAKADTERYRRLYEETFASHQKLEQVEAQSQSNRAKWMAAQAASASAQSGVGQAENQLKSASTSDLQITVRQAELSLAFAMARQAEADLTNAQLMFSYTKIYAPKTGRVTKKSVSEGDMIQRGQVLTQLVAGLPWVIANFKETQLTHMRPNQMVAVRVDAFPDLKLTGHVRAIQPGTGAHFSLLPPENATGNFVKVVQRVPVVIDLDDPGPEASALLVLGLSVTPKVDVSKP